MSISSPTFLIWFFLTLFLLLVLVKRGGSSWWIGYLAMNIVFLISRGLSSIFWFFGLALFVLHMVSEIINANSKEQKKKAQIIYLFSLLVIFFVWLIARIYHKEAIGTSLSYISFVLIAYLTEVYWNNIKVKPNILSLSAAITSLNMVSSGPIPLIKNLTSQIEKPLSLAPELIREALFRIFCGLAKKSLADHIFQYNQFNWANGNSSGILSAWIAEFLRASHLYADFSGYADIAIGLGILLGHRLPENFHLPFLSTSVGTYWRNWNSSTTYWFLTYLFTPLSLGLRRLSFGNSRFSLYIPLFASTYLTLLVIGLWHGFSFNQVIWATFVALLIIIENIFPIQRFISSKKLGIFICWLTTFYFMTIARIFSTETELETALSLVRRLHVPTEVIIYASHIYAISLAFVSIVGTHFVDYLRIKHSENLFSGWRWPVYIFIFLTLIILFSGLDEPFVYEGF